MSDFLLAHLMQKSIAWREGFIYALDPNCKYSETIGYVDEKRCSRV